MVEHIKDLEAKSRKLELPFEDRISLTAKAIRYGQQFLNELPEKKAFDESGNMGKGILDHDIEEHPEELDELLRALGNDVDTPGLNPASAGHLGYIPGGGLYPSALADFIAAVTNRYAGVFFSSPGAVRIENMCIRWMCNLIGYDKNSGGNLTSGGSIANLVGLVTARDHLGIKAKDFDRAVIYTTKQVHHCVIKAIKFAGLKEAHVRKVEMDERYRMKPEALEKQIEKDKEDNLIPLVIFASAGTTDLGAVDPLDDIARLAEEHNIWFHVDAAYGGPAAAVPRVSSYFEGIEEADSVVINPHKWMYVPFEAGGVLVKNPEHLRQTFSTIPDYLKSDKSDNTRTDLMEYNLPLTKEFKSLKVWMTLKTYGAAKIRETIEADIERADYLARLIKKHESLEMMAPAPLSIVCFRYNPGGLDESQLDRLNDHIVEEIESDGRIFLTGTKIKGKSALRVCFINHRTTNNDIDFLVNVVTEIGKKLEQHVRN